MGRYNYRYEYETQDRDEMARELLTDAGYSPADYAGKSNREIGWAIEEYYEEMAARGRLVFPTWDDGDSVYVAEYIERYLDKLTSAQPQTGNA